jgi:BlaI family transcriptional regulator, penicillinase repressor
MPKRSVQLTEAEWTIIRAVWDQEPCTAPAIQQKLLPSKGWSYSTVRTLMDRMTAKGLLKGEKTRNITLFRSAVSREQAQRSELLSTLKTAFNGALAPMVQFLLRSSDLSSRELDELEELIRQKRRSSGKPKPG